MLQYGWGLMRQATWVILRQIAACRKQWWSSAGLQFLFGVLVGVFLGFAVIFDYETEVTSITKPFPVNKLGFDDATNGSSIPVQCVVFIHPNQKRKSQYVEALRDTFTRQCTLTIYISNSQEIRQHFWGKHFSIVHCVFIGFLNFYLSRQRLQFISLCSKFNKWSCKTD